jgi:hypothetical protein
MERINDETVGGAEAEREAQDVQQEVWGAGALRLAAPLPRPLRPAPPLPLLVGLLPPPPPSLGGRPRALAKG